MRTIPGIFLAFILLAPFSRVVAQTNTEARASDQTEVTAQQPIKVDEARKVVRIGHVQKMEKKEVVKYDKKGGIIVPNASKGIRQSQLSRRQSAKLEQMKKATNRPQAPVMKDLNAKRKTVATPKKSIERAPKPSTPQDDRSRD